MHYSSLAYIKFSLTTIDPKLFYTGTILATLSAIIIGILNVGVLYLFGIPLLLFVIGIVLLWIAKKNVRAKSLVTLISIGIIPVSFFAFIALNRAESEVFLIPENFRGEFVVFYEEPCGQKIYEDGKRIYKIPADGILITNFDKNKGFLNRKFYFLNESGEKTEMPIFNWQSFDSEKANWNKLHAESSENFTKETVGAFWSYGSETYYISKNSFSYIISDFSYYDKDTEKRRWLEGKQFAEKAEKILNQCRQNSNNNE